MRLKYDNVNENYLHDASQSESFEKCHFEERKRREILMMAVC